MGTGREGFALGRARTGQRGLGDEDRRCSGQLPTARTQGKMTGWPHEDPVQLWRCCNRLVAWGHTCHLPRPVAATIRGFIRDKSGQSSPPTTPAPCWSLHVERRQRVGLAPASLRKGFDDPPRG